MHATPLSPPQPRRVVPATTFKAEALVFALISRRDQSEARSAAARTIAREQTEAALAVATEIRKAAERQWQPWVIAHGWKGPQRGDGDNAAPDEMAVRYWLENKGTGPAFNVLPSVEVAGRTHTLNDWQYRSMSAGEAIPPVSDPQRRPFPDSSLVIPVPLAEWSDDFVYCASFENQLGERFEVRN
jgi:hypothetical protein